MTDKMREEFEAWYEGVTGLPVEFNDVGIPVSIGSALSETTTMGMWLAWRASRESLCVELPESYSRAISNDFDDGFGQSLSWCKDSLDAAGVSYK